MSVFIDADKEQIKAAENIGVQVCEIHTGPYAHVFHSQEGTNHPQKCKQS